MVPRRPGHISSKATVSPGDGQRWATSPVELCRRRREALQRPAMLLPASTGRPLEKATQKARFQPTHCSRALRGGSSPSKQREAARFHTVHTTAAGTMAASVSRVPVAESRLHRAVSGRLRRPPRGPLRGGSGRVRRRAVGLRGFVYFVGTHTRSTVPLGRSAAALGAVIEGPQILFLSERNRVGKGLRLGRWVAGSQYVNHFCEGF